MKIECMNHVACLCIQWQIGLLTPGMREAGQGRHARYAAPGP